MNRQRGGWSVRRGKGLRFTAALTAVLLLAKTKEQLQQELDDLQREAAAIGKDASQLSASISGVQAEIDEEQQNLDSMRKRVENTRAQIELMTDKLALLDKEIAAKNREIEDKEGEIAGQEAAIQDQKDQLGCRLRTVSKMGNLSSLQMLMDTKEYADYLIKTRMADRIAQNDQQLIEQLERELEAIRMERERLTVGKTVLARQKEAAESVKKEQDAKKKEIDTLYKKIQASIQTLQNKKGVVEAELRRKKQEEEETQRQIKNILNQMKETGNPGGKYGGSMFWPVPAVHAISSGFGSRWGTVHKGIDIANGRVPVYGQEVVAAADGVVIYAIGTNTWGGGYGYYTMVDHGLDGNGNHIVTLYAHCSRMYAKVGQKVVGGQTVLALAGYTGDVTGPHLHFEVRVNGVAVDPIKNGYVSL